MKILDANILIYAYNKSASLHLSAERILEDLINSGNIVGIPWIVLQAFVRLMTGRQVLDNPYTADEIVKITDSWFERSNVQLLPHGLETYKIFSNLLTKYRLTGAVTTDVTIATSVIEYEGVLISNDTDFLRFEEIKVENLLLT